MHKDIEIVHPKIEKYLEDMLPRREGWFLEMEKLAEDKGFPAVGPQVGIFLETLARTMNAKRILELGSGFGYSGLWFARALPPDGYLLLCDFEVENQELAENFFKKAGKSHLMEFKTGNALEVLNQAKGPFDIVFNDIDKELYPQVIDPVFQHLRKGGLLITDNTLWYGRVTQNQKDKATTAVQEFNNRLKNHKGFMTSQLPLRDGISISVKIKEEI